MLKKLRIINDCFPSPPEDFQAVKAVEEAEKKWKTKKSVTFGCGNVLPHAGLQEHHGVDDQQQNHGKASWDNVKLTKKAAAEEPSLSNKGILSQASQRERQGAEDVEQLCDKQSDDNGKKTMSASQHFDKNNQ